MKVTKQTVLSTLRKYPVLTVATFVCIPLVIVCFLRDDVIIEQQEILDKFRAEAALCRANIANSSQLQQQVDFLVRVQAAIAKRSFPAESVPLNLQYFYKLETDIGIKYLDLNPGGRTTLAKAKPQAKAAYVSLNYRVSVQGSFFQIITYLRSLEQGAFFCRINSATVLSSGSNVTLNMDLDLLGIQ